MSVDPGGLQRHYQNKKVLITGGLGMIGSSIALELVSLGADVTLVDAIIEPFGANHFNISPIRDKVTVNISDIRDKESMKSLVAGKDIIFNLAGQVSHNDSIENPFLDAEINYLGHLNVLEACRKVSPEAKILFSGSRLQFGEIERIPVAEDHPLRPKTPYALNKVAAENLYLYYHRVYGQPTVVFRIANPYGPRAQMKHPKYAMINWFLRLAMEGKCIRIFGDGKQIRDYIYIQDLAEAFILAAASDRVGGEIFNVGSGVGTRFKDMAGSIVRILNKGEIEFVPWPEEYLNIETGDYVTDISKARRLLGWAPKTSLEEGIRRTHEFYKKFREYYW
ncbi:MAG: GDP-mannose 4,6-dehydratase [Candidatus Aminicenantes bacterium]|nr:GDP-mannose 4,6-dehydratase [Candidatus Aminicenantes bacterium]